MLELLAVAVDADEPLLLAEAKAHLVVEHDADDAIIRTLTRAARRSIETKTGLSLAKETWRETFRNMGFHSLDTSRRPVQEIVAFGFRASEADAYADRKADFTVEYGTIRRATTSSTNYLYGADDHAIRVDYIAGMSRAMIPDDILAAVRLQLGFLYANRGDMTSRDAIEDPNGAIMSLIGPWRRLGA